MLVLAWITALHARLQEDRGATAVEYGLLIAGIAALVMVAVFAFGPALAGLFGDVTAQLGG